MSLKAADILNFLGEAREEIRTMLPEKADNITVGDQMYNTMDMMREDNFFMKEEYGEEEFPPVMYGLLFAPFAEWILQTEYGPELEFLLKTEINIFE